MPHFAGNVLILLILSCWFFGIGFTYSLSFPFVADSKFGFSESVMRKLIISVSLLQSTNRRLLVCNHNFLSTHWIIDLDVMPFCWARWSLIFALASTFDLTWSVLHFFDEFAASLWLMFAVEGILFSFLYLTLLTLCHYICSSFVCMWGLYICWYMNQQNVITCFFLTFGQIYIFLVWWAKQSKSSITWFIFDI